MPKKIEEENERKEATKTATNDEMELLKHEIGLKEELKNKLIDDISKLTRIEATIEQNIKDYGNARDKFESRKNELEKYYKLKEPMIETVIKDKKATIDKEIQKYDDNIVNIQKEIQKGENETIPAARSEYYATVKDSHNLKHQCKKKRAEIKNYETSIKEKLDKLEKEKAEVIDNLDETKQGPEIYIRLNEFNRVLGEIDLKTPDDFAKEFYELWKKFDNIDKQRQDKKQKCEITIEEIKEKERSYKKIKEERLTEFLKIIAKQPWANLQG